MKFCIYLFITFTLPFFISCVTSNKISTFLPQPTSGPLFPDGTYKQDVEVKLNVPNNDSNSDFSFQAAIKKQPQNFVMLSYNNLGFSLFRIEDAPPQPLQWSCEIEMLNKNKDFFLKIYPQIKKIFSLNGSDLKKEQNNYYWRGDNFKIDFVSFTPQGRPLKMTMSDQTHYWVNIVNI